MNFIDEREIANSISICVKSRCCITEFIYDVDLLELYIKKVLRKDVDINDIHDFQITRFMNFNVIEYYVRKNGLHHNLALVKNGERIFTLETNSCSNSGFYGVETTCCTYIDNKIDKKIKKQTLKSEDVMMHNIIILDRNKKTNDYEKTICEICSKKGKTVFLRKNGINYPYIENGQNLMIEDTLNKIKKINSNILSKFYSVLEDEVVKDYKINREQNKVKYKIIRK